MALDPQRYARAKGGYWSKFLPFRQWDSAWRSVPSAWELSTDTEDRARGLKLEDRVGHCWCVKNCGNFRSPS